MKRAVCERAWELDAYRDGQLGPQDTPSFERHLRSCAECAERKAGDERLRDLARRLPDTPPDALGVRRMRRRILNDAAMGTPDAGASRVRPWLVLAVTCAMASVGVFAYRTVGGPTRPTSAASAQTTPAPEPALAPPRLAGAVKPAQGARWSQTREGDVERVRLDDGTVEVHVRPQLAYERFIVSVPDGEIEVRGTTFDVTVEGGHTTAVRVVDGIVEVRLVDHPVRRVAAGDTWTEGAPVAPAQVPAAAHNPPPVVAASASTAGRAAATDDGTAAYSEAVRILGAGRNEDAAGALRAFVLAHPSAPQVEDATFLEAVALARAGRTDAAGLAAEQHLTRFPDSFHRKEAGILIERAARLRDAGR